MGSSDGSAPVLWSARHETPLGEMMLVASPAGLVRALLPGSAFEAELAAQAREYPGAEIVDEPSMLGRYVRALDLYFDGAPLDPSLPVVVRGTAFQRAVWDRLERIPYGEVRTYGEIAAEVGRPGASRAVGAACGANPVPLFVPCHRVVASGGGLGGFGGGLELKRRLLREEGVELG